MWWECRHCPAGGNSPKSQHQHERDFPDHKLEVEIDLEKEDS